MGGSDLGRVSMKEDAERKTEFKKLRAKAEANRVKETGTERFT